MVSGTVIGAATATAAAPPTTTVAVATPSDAPFAKLFNGAQNFLERSAFFT